MPALGLFLIRFRVTIFAVHVMRACDLPKFQQECLNFPSPLNLARDRDVSRTARQTYFTASLICAAIRIITMTLSSPAIWRSRGACVRAGYILRNAVVVFFCRWIVGCSIQLIYPVANWVQGVVVFQAAPLVVNVKCP